MKMSGIASRIEWKHSRIPAGPASGRNSPLKSRNLCFADYGTFFRSLEKFGKLENPTFLLAMWSKLFLSGWKWSGVNRRSAGRAMSRKRPSPPRKPRVSDIRSAGYPIFDLAISGLQGPRIGAARRGTMALGDRKTLRTQGRFAGTLRYLE